MPVLDRIRPLIGTTAPFNRARDEVNLPMIRHWCDVMDEGNPVYTDPEFAAGSAFGAIVAPPAMMDVWDKPGLRAARDPGNPQSVVLGLLEEEGFTSTVAVNSDLECGRYLRLGDLVHSTLTLEDVSGEKQTALGAGHFVTSRLSYFVGDDLVGSVLFRVLKFRPGTGRTITPAGTTPAASAPSTPPPARQPRREETLTAAEVSEGGELPPCPIPVTTTLIAGGALMTLDWFDAHHDRDMAVSRGSSDVFMNIHTTLGLIERYVSDWAGPEAIWRAIRVRLGAPNYPGDTMTFRAEVRAADHATGDVTVEYRGTNGLGDHASGTAELRLSN